MQKRANNLCQRCDGQESGPNLEVGHHTIAVDLGWGGRYISNWQSKAA